MPKLCLKLILLLNITHANLLGMETELKKCIRVPDGFIFVNKDGKLKKKKHPGKIFQEEEIKYTLLEQKILGLYKAPNNNYIVVISTDKNPDPNLKNSYTNISIISLIKIKNWKYDKWVTIKPYDNFSLGNVDGKYITDSCKFSKDGIEFELQFENRLPHVFTSPVL